DGSSRYTSHAERHRLTVSAGWPARTDRLGLSIGRTPVSEKEQLRCGFELAWLTEAANTPPCGRAQTDGICGLARKDRQAGAFHRADARQREGAAALRIRAGMADGS